MADLPDPISIGNPNVACASSAGCNVQTLEPNELPLGKVTVTYKVTYKYVSRNKPTPYGWFELGIPLYRGGMKGGKFAIQTEILNVSDISPADFNDGTNFEKAWNFAQSQLAPNEREGWEGNFSSVKPKLVAAYNNNNSAEIIKNALIQDQTPVVFTPEFANMHAVAVNYDKCPLGKGFTYVKTLSSKLNVSAAPVTRGITRSLGKGKGEVRDRIETKIYEEVPRLEGPPELKLLKAFCDTYVFADNAFGSLRIFPGFPVAEKDSILAKYTANNPARQKILNYKPNNLVELRDAVPNLTGAEARELMALRLSRFQGSSGGGLFSYRSKALYVGGQVGSIGETAVFVEGRVPPLNADKSQFKLGIGIVNQLGTGADGKAIVEATRIQIESSEVTVESGVRAALRLSVQVVEKVGQLCFSKNKTTAVKAAEAKAAVTNAVTNGIITTNQGVQTNAFIDNLSNGISNGGNNTPSQILTNALVGTNGLYRPPSDYNGLTFGGLPGTNTGGLIIQGNGQAVPNPNGGIIDNLGNALNNAQTNLPGINPGPQTGGSYSNNPVPDSLGIVNTNNPAPGESNSNGAQNILTNSFVQAGVAGSGGTLEIRNPSDGTTTNVVVDPGELISHATNSPHVPQDEYQQPNSFMPTPLPGYGGVNVIYITGPTTPTTPTTGITSKVVITTETTDGKPTSVSQDQHGAVAPGYGLGGVLQGLPTVFEYMPNIIPGSSSSSTEPGTTNSSLIDWLNTLPSAGNGSITITDEFE
jgi:hypothetical protein